MKSGFSFNIRIWSLKGDCEVRIYAEASSAKKIPCHSVVGRDHLYQYLQVTDQYIYLLYSGHKENEPQKEQIIRIMDWDGNPTAQYLIPEEYDLSTFDVDEKQKTFYGSSYNNDAIYVFSYE